MLREGLVFCFMRLGVPFIALRQLGAVGDQLGRQFLPSIEWCTGQSGAPPDSYCSSPVHSFFPFLAHPTVEPAVLLAHQTCSVHTGQSGVPNRPLARATCRPLISLPTVGSGGSDSPDSPVNYSHGVLGEFPRATSSSLNTLGAGTEDSPDSPVNFSHKPGRFSRAASSPSSSPGHRTVIPKVVSHRERDNSLMYFVSIYYHM
jgi:hypothetical protein